MAKMLVKKTNLNKIKNSIIVNKFSNNHVYYLHNSYGLGDSIFNFIFFNLIQKYIEYNDIKIFYYAKKNYLLQLKEFICSKNIFLASLEHKPDISIEVWIDNPLFGNTFATQKQPVNYNHYYKIFFTNVLNKLNMKFSINKLFYTDTNLIDRYNNISNKYKEIDILVVNSQPYSGQYKYNKTQWDTYISLLSNSFKIATTTKINNLLCTFDDNLTIKDIASISTNVKVIIAINSGVLPGLLNDLTLKNVKKFYIFDNRCYYSYPNFENKKLITDISIAELKILV